MCVGVCVSFLCCMCLCVYVCLCVCVCCVYVYVCMMCAFVYTCVACVCGIARKCGTMSRLLLRLFLKRRLFLLSLSYYSKNMLFNIVIGIWTNVFGLALNCLPVDILQRIIFLMLLKQLTVLVIFVQNIRHYIYNLKLKFMGQYLL